MMTQGVAVGAYVGMGTMFKAMGDNADRFGKAKPVLEFMKKHSHAIRIATAGGLMGMGLLTLNPIPTFIGMKFAMMGITGALCKISMNLVKKIIKKPEVEGKFNKVVDKVFGILNKPPQKVDPDKKPSKIRTALGEAKKAIYANRRNIAMIGITAGVENILQGVFGATTKLMWGKTLGSMTLETGNLSFMDKSKNTLIGAYRYYNLPSTALKRGANTKQFYEEIKTKYNPATAAEWGAAVDKEVKLASVKDLYGSPMAYITSEDAAKVLTFNGVSGRYADTAGKAALLQNMLKMSGLSKSNKIVIGMPEAGSGVTYAWVTDSDVLGNKSTELYRFDSAGNAVERLSPGKGINNEIVRSASKGFYGNIMTDQVLSNLIYKGIEGIANKMLGVKQKREEKKEQKEQLRAQKEMLKAQQVQPQILPEPELSAAAG